MAKKPPEGKHGVLGVAPVGANKCVSVCEARRARISWQEGKDVMAKGLKGVYLRASSSLVLDCGGDKKEFEGIQGPNVQ
eukprot:1039426-Pelagomonas_calceolata.AAC.4